MSGRWADWPRRRSAPVTDDEFERGVGLGRHLQWLQSYGEAGAHPSGYTDVRDKSIGVTHPTYATPAALEDQMADLLSDILTAPVLTRAQLADEGVRWPGSDVDRRPNLPMTGELLDELEPG